MTMTMRSTERGYTAVEVLSAMMLLAIGAAGVIGMQKVTIQGGTDARRFDIATNIAHEWIEKLQRDSAFWTKPNRVDTSNNVTTDTRWLRDIATGACTGPVNFCNPQTGIAANGLDSFAYDAIGRAIGPYSAASVDTWAHFCVLYRFNYIADPSLTVLPAAPQGAIRAEVLVVFNRLEYGPIPDCANIAATGPAPVPVGAPATYHYHYVHAETVVRRNPLQ